jgi:drug/metabolite transporter (DMT)-like permease
MTTGNGSGWQTGNRWPPEIAARLLDHGTVGNGADGGGRLDSTSRFNSTAFGVICGIGASLFWTAGFAGIRHGLNAGFSPADLVVHRYLWSGLALLPFVMRAGINDLNGIGWGRGLLLVVLGGPVYAIIGYAGFLLVPLGHGGVIQPSSGTLGGLLLAALVLGETLIASRVVGALIIVCGLVVVGGEAVATIGAHGVVGDLLFVLTGLMFATFGTLLRLWRIAAMPATAVISVLSLFTVPVHWLLGGFDQMIALGWRENLLQAVLQGVLAGPIAIYLFARSVALLGAGRAAIFLSLVPPFVLLLGWLALGEVPSTLQLIGLVIVLFGFRFAQKAEGAQLVAVHEGSQGRLHHSKFGGQCSVGQKHALQQWPVHLDQRT